MCDLDLMECYRVFASSEFMYLKAVLSYRTHTSVVMVRQSLPTAQCSMERTNKVFFVRDRYNGI